MNHEALTRLAWVLMFSCAFLVSLYNATAAASETAVDAYKTKVHLAQSVHEVIDIDLTHAGLGLVKGIKIRSPSVDCRLVLNPDVSHSSYAQYQFTLVIVAKREKIALFGPASGWPWKSAIWTGDHVLHQLWPVWTPRAFIWPNFYTAHLLLPGKEFAITINPSNRSDRPTRSVSVPNQNFDSGSSLLPIYHSMDVSAEVHYAGEGATAQNHTTHLVWHTFETRFYSQAVVKSMLRRIQKQILTPKRGVQSRESPQLIQGYLDRACIRLQAPPKKCTMSSIGPSWSGPGPGFSDVASAHIATLRPSGGCLISVPLISTAWPINQERAK